MNPWIVNPVWQNFSSLYREATAGHEAKTGMERSHHLTASLYFGISSLEAFLNRKMRGHLAATKSEQKIYETLRKGKILDKLKKWPELILGKQIGLQDETLELITYFNEIRGDLTHPKTHGHDIYEKLEQIEPRSVIEAVAEYMVRFHEAEGTLYPYWLFGWNYLNPRTTSYEIFIVNEQQFCFSLQALGFQISAAIRSKIAPWQAPYLGTYQGYSTLRQMLSEIHHCQPKADRFPLMPILCRRWWMPEHQLKCGHVTTAAIQVAKGA